MLINEPVVAGCFRKPASRTTRRFGGGLALVWLLAGCQPEVEAPKRPFLYTGPIVETTDVQTLFSDSARLKFKLRASLEQKYENGDVWYRKGVLLTFYTRDGRVQNTLRGNVGHFDKAKNTYHVKGHVQIVSALRQERVDTEELYFDQNRQQIYNDTTTFVRIETATEILTGKGLKANKDFSRYSLLKPVGTFTIKDSPQ